MKSKLLLGFVGLCAVSVAILRRHEEQVKFMHFIQTGEKFGCDWTWAPIAESGWIPAPKNLRTGVVTQYPLMG